MKNRKKTFSAACFCILAMIALPVLPAAAAEDAAGAVTGSVTITVYDGETGELFDSEYVSMEIISGKYQTKPKYGSFHTHGTWLVSEHNPYTAPDVQLLPEYNAFVELINNSAIYDAEPYTYVIDETRSDTVFNFDESTEQKADIYVVKKYDEGASGGFWVYLGTTPDEQYPVLMQYYPEPAVEGSFHVRRIRYQGKADFPFSYGDIFVTEDIVNPVKNVITADVDWKKTDNCGELSDIRTVTIGSKNADSLWIQDENHTDYRYRILDSDVQTAIKLDDAQSGDSIRFAFYEGIPVLPLTAPEHHHPSGDVSGDNLLRNDDALLLKNYLLSDPAAKLTDWKAGDLNNDGILTAADLSLLKQAIQKQSAQPHCKLTLTTTQNGSSIDGKRLPTRTRQDTFIVRTGDYFGENGSGWMQNDPVYTLDNTRKTITVEKITPEGVTVRFYYGKGEENAKTFELAYGEETDKGTLIPVMDGYISTYTLSFSDYSADGITQHTPPEKMPVIAAENGSISAEEREQIWELIAAKYPNSDFSDFTLRYDPEHPLKNQTGGKVFSVLYKGILVHGYGNLSLEGNAYAYISQTKDGKIIRDAEFMIPPEKYAEIEIPETYLSAEEIIAAHDLSSTLVSDPELIIFLDYNADCAARVAYRAEDYIGETIYDAVTGERITDIFFVVPN